MLLCTLAYHFLPALVLIAVALLVMLGWAVWRGDPVGRLRKRRDKYIKKVSKC